MSSREILILDDEPHVLDWLTEYLATKGYKCVFAMNVENAIELLSAQQFRTLVIDLNVPAPGHYSTAIANKGDIYTRYKGLYVADYARNMGYRDRQVIVYSVHDLDEVRAVTDRIRVTYITKGRPRVFKEEIEDVLSFDPTAATPPTKKTV